MTEAEADRQVWERATIERLRQMAVGARFESGMLRIAEGRCPIGATNPIACWGCSFGHATECHHPLECAEAKCDHYVRHGEAR